MRERSMESGFIKVRRWLLPLSWLYGAGVAIRDALYETGILSSYSFTIPTIGVGNITCGGTGKTPHVEYIVRLLTRAHHKVAVLSRGYKRRGSGYVLATRNTPMQYIGDEPWQMCHKLRGAYVAVDKDRVRGIQRLANDESTRDVEVIVMDDAYQHLSVIPGLNILLVDYNRLITDDELLPAGRLRESAEAKMRASVVIVTKCPPTLAPMGFRVVQKSLNLRPYQELYFSTYRYGGLKGLFIDGERSLDSLRPQESVLLLTGIAEPEHMREDMKHYTSNLKLLAFPDHHQFTAADIRHINAVFARMPQPCVAITTEKDATRLMDAEGLSDELMDALYVAPVEVEVLRGEGDKLDKTITNYVRKHPRNVRVVKHTDNN